MLCSVAPKVASAAAAVAAASSSHGNVALYDFQPTLAERVRKARKMQAQVLLFSFFNLKFVSQFYSFQEVVSYGKNSGSSPWSDISDEWNFIHNCSSSFIEEKPSIEETEEAMVAVFKAFGA